MYFLRVVCVPVHLGDQGVVGDIPSPAKQGEAAPPGSVLSAALTINSLAWFPSKMTPSLSPPGRAARGGALSPKHLHA